VNVKSLRNQVDEPLCKAIGMLAQGLTYLQLFDVMAKATAMICDMFLASFCSLYISVRQITTRFRED